VQAWQILIGAAMNRQIITYSMLAEAMYGRKAAGVLDKILAYVEGYCSHSNSPHLTSIVVGSGRGKPGRFNPVDLKAVDKEREKVYAYDWYDVYPPKAEELRKGFGVEVDATRAG
jgi:hypothetical protein